jgi:endonuclease/exonuclease/phosphatase family metal-dependent hydrolase
MLLGMRPPVASVVARLGFAAWLATAACSSSDTPAPMAADAGAGGDARVALKVMTRNLFLGSDLGADLLQGMLPQTVAEVPPRAAVLWQNIQNSDIPARAQLIAAEIIAAQPDIVGLQEVELYRVQQPSDMPGAMGANATMVVYDALDALMAALARQSPGYSVAVANQLTDFELPTGTDPAMLEDVRITDRDVILVKQGLTYKNAATHTFMSFVPINLGAGTSGQGIPVNIKRGYETIEVELEGVSFTFLNSHLEVGGQFLKLFQQAQAKELIAGIDAIPSALIALGDFNSAAENADTTSYADLTMRLTDPWKALHPGDPGLTCCSPLAAPFMPTGRLDLVLTRGSVQVDAAEVVGTTKLTAGGLRASDHAGVVMTLSLPKGG